MSTRVVCVWALWGSAQLRHSSLRLPGVLVADSSLLVFCPGVPVSQRELLCPALYLPSPWGQPSSKDWWAPKTCAFSVWDDSRDPSSSSASWTRAQEYAPRNLQNTYLSQSISWELDLWRCGKTHTGLLKRMPKGWGWEEMISFFSIYIHTSSLITMSTYHLYHLKIIEEI